LIQEKYGDVTVQVVKKDNGFNAMPDRYASTLDD
jgi:hypothetical protein